MWIKLEIKPGKTPVPRIVVLWLRMTTLAGRDL